MGFCCLVCKLFSICWLGDGKSKDANSEQATIDTLAGDLDELVKALDLRDFTLLGWSMGAAVVLRYTELFGCDLLKQIVLCDMTPQQINDDEWKLGLYQGRYTSQDMERDKEKSFYKLYKEFAIAAIPRLKKVPRFLLKRPLQEKLMECDEDVIRSLSRSLKATDLRESVGKITVPFHYFYAVPGSLYSPALADWYREHVTSLYDATAFDNSTHMLINDNPDKFAQEVIRVISCV